MRIMNSIEDIKPKPFVKWAGGKRQLLKQFKELDLYPPNTYDRMDNKYFEPFLGGGAVFFDLLPERAILSDSNRELITTYKVIRDNVEELILSLKEHVYEKEYYLKIRAQNVEELSDIEVASRFLFLNRTGFNGLYRVNRKGQFNVPFGRYTNPIICDEVNLRAVSKTLQRVAVEVKDYRKVLEKAKKGDFIYFDPPYYPVNETSYFTSYTSDKFLKEEQKELRDVFVKLHRRGCLVMLSNSDTPLINDLYSGIEGIKVNKLFAKRSINAKAAKRGKVTEVLVTNYLNNKEITMEKDFEAFINSLKSSIKTWDYFVNRNKVFKNSSELEILLNNLNYLLGKDNLKKEFTKLYKTNPNIVKALPVLIAAREKKFEVYDKYTKESEFFDFTRQDRKPEDYYEFIVKTGLVKLFQQDGIKNLVDYVVGVEVGLDSNGRKNRTGKLMEEIVQVFLDEFCSLNNLEYMAQARPAAIKKEWGVEVKVDKSARSFDFAVYNSHNNKLKLFETNFYNGGGSKLKAVCGEFKGLYDELQVQDIELVWVTDGLGWNTAKRPLEETYNHNDHVFNLSMLEDGVLLKLDW
ncbi:MAG: DpnII family type II restriction endonuclease [Micrococcaceae bacterium]